MIRAGIIGAVLAPRRPRSSSTDATRPLCVLVALACGARRSLGEVSRRRLESRLVLAGALGRRFRRQAPPYVSPGPCCATRARDALGDNKASSRGRDAKTQQQHTPVISTAPATQASKPRACHAVGPRNSFKADASPSRHHSRAPGHDGRPEHLQHQHHHAQQERAGLLLRAGAGMAGECAQTTPAISPRGGPESGFAACTQPPTSLCYPWTAPRPPNLA